VYSSGQLDNIPNRAERLKGGEPVLSLPSAQEETTRILNGRAPSAALSRAAKDAGLTPGKFLLRQLDSYPSFQLPADARQDLLRSSRGPQGITDSARTASGGRPRPVQTAAMWFFDALTGARPSMAGTLPPLQGGGRNGGGPFMASPAGGKGSLPVSNLGSLARSAGFPTEQAVIMAAIAMAESSGRARAHNNNRSTGDDSYGLWQINMIDRLGPERRRQLGIGSNDALFDPATNARAARQVYLSQGFGAWSVYKNGAYRQYLPEARRAITGR